MFGVGAGIDSGVSPRTFAVTFDYRCPFARVAHEHVLDGLDAGAAWDVHFSPFSLSAAKDGTWQRSSDSGLLALELAIAVRDGQPDRFLAVHRALFEHRHDHGGDLRDLDALAEVLRGAGVDVDEALAAIETGVPLKTVRDEHEAAESDHTVWGVPTFIAGGQAAFVRLMERPSEAEVRGAAAIDRIVDMLTGWPELNEFKHTSLPR
jgi:predicted DsbA family dithiol-disulfide isomerase